LTNKLLITILISLNGCVSLNNFDDYMSLITETFVSKKITEEDLKNINQNEILIISFNNKNEFLVYSNENNDIWSSIDDTKFLFKNGKLIRTFGMENNFEIINFIDVNYNHEAYINFKSPESGYLNINFSYTKISEGDLYLRTLRKNVAYELIREDFSVDSIFWSGSNYYWIDVNKNVIMSKQVISPFGDKIRISK
tara:strand:- start:3440 stop:4027 length:588 start_codon:yes stop_codon:yes gene_type:complete